MDALDDLLIGKYAVSKPQNMNSSCGDSSSPVVSASDDAIAKARRVLAKILAIQHTKASGGRA